MSEMKKIKPKQYDTAIGAPSKEARKKPVYPTIRIDHEHFPEGKDMKVGEKRNLHMEVKMVGNSQSRYQNEGEYEIHRLGADEKAKEAADGEAEEAADGERDEGEKE